MRGSLQRQKRPFEPTLDVSHHQKVIRWQEAYQGGVKGAILRATMGIGGVDSQLAYNGVQALKAGVQIGFYHLIRPEYSGIDQARHFMNTLAAYRNEYKALAVDLEIAGVTAKQLYDFLEYIRSFYGIKCWIYTSAGAFNQLSAEYDREFREYPLWVANYTTADQPLLPRAWDTYILWQYTSTGQVDGIVGDVDLNRPYAPPKVFKLQAPVIPMRITQAYGARPEYYAKWGLVGHEGVDVGGFLGAPIYAAADGTVKLVTPDNGVNNYGNQVRIAHWDGEYETISAHLSLFTAGLRVGQSVRAGDVIGYMGDTGNSEGVHLHFGLKHRGATARGETQQPSDLINPTPYLP